MQSLSRHWAPTTCQARWLAPGYTVMSKHMAPAFKELTVKATLQSELTGFLCPLLGVLEDINFAI